MRQRVKELETIVSQVYGMQAPSCFPLTRGDNDLYLVHVGREKYVLRIYRLNKFWLSSRENYLFELDWLLFLKKQGCSVSYPIVRLDGGYLGRILQSDGVHEFALFSFAQGKAGDLSKVQAKQLGQELGRLHLVSKNYCSNYSRHHLDEKFLLQDPWRRIRQFLTHDRSFFERLIYTLSMKLQDSALLEYDKTVVIGDFHGYDQRIDQRGTITFLDMDYCAYGSSLFDVAYFKANRAREEPALWQPFLQGYCSVNTIDSRQLRLLDLIILAQQVWLIATVTYTRHASTIINEDFWRQQVHKLKELEKLCIRQKIL